MDRNIKKLRYLAIIFILVGLIIGGLNQGLPHLLGEDKIELINLIYLIFENVFRTIVVILASYLSIKYYRDKKKDLSNFRKNNLMVLSLLMLTVYILFPVLFNSLSISSLFMPFAWSSFPFQIMHQGAFFSHQYNPDWSPDFILSIYLLFQVTILIGTILIGRRWSCSMLCPFMAVHSESLGEALPLYKSPKVKKKIKDKKILFYLKVFVLIFMGLIYLAWIVYFVFSFEIISLGQLILLEKIKYIVFEVLLAYLLWIFMSPRGYCNYCPAGTILGLVARLSGQRIETGLSKCTGCGLCNKACPMNIDIREMALNSEAVRDINCVGCGRCVEACPTNNLQYTSNFLKSIGANINVSS